MVGLRGTKQINTISKVQLRPNINSSVVSQHIVELELPKTSRKTTSATNVPVTSKSTTEAYSDAQTELGKANYSPDMRRVPLRKGYGQKEAKKKGSNLETPEFGRTCKKTGAIKKKKAYTKTLPKAESFYDSSSYCVSHGQVIYEAFWDLESPQSSISLNSSSTGDCPSHPKEKSRLEVSGIRNINYDDSKFSGTDKTSPRKPPLFVYLPDSGSTATLRKKPKTIFTSISMARKTLSSQLFLGTLIPPSDEDIAIYNKKKINDRKQMIYKKWKKDKTALLDQ